MSGEVDRGGERVTQKAQNQNGAKGSSQNGEQQTEIEKLIIRCKADLATLARLPGGAPLPNPFYTRMPEGITEIRTCGPTDLAKLGS